MCVCVCVCVCSSEFMDETLLSMGVYLVNSAHIQFGANCGGGGGGCGVGGRLHGTLRLLST